MVRVRESIDIQPAVSDVCLSDSLHIDYWLFCNATAVSSSPNGTR